MTVTANRLATFLSIALVGVSMWFAFGTSQVHAQGVESEDVQAVDIPLNDKLILKDGTPVQEVFNSTDDIINLVVQLLFVGAGAVLLFMIVGAGLAMVQGGSADKDKAKNTMTSAAVGLILMLAAYWIMQILELLTGIELGF